MSRPARLPRRYWGCILCIAILIALLFGLIGLTVFLTGSRRLGQFGRTEWMIFAAFLFSAAIIVVGAFAIAVGAGRILTEHRHHQFLAHLHEGVNPADYACILPELEDDRRALITRTDGGFHLIIESHDGQCWQRESDLPSPLPDMAAVLACLQDEYAFFCDPEDLPCA